MPRDVKKAAIPKDERPFRSKSQLALDMLKIAQERGIQFGYVGIDGGYGKEPAFCGVSMNKAADLSRMCIAIKLFISKIQYPACPSGQGMADTPFILNRTVHRNASINGRRSSRPMLGGV